MKQDYLKRRARLTQRLNDLGLDAVILVPGANFFYYTGLSFHLMERPTFLVATKNGGIGALIPELEQLIWQSDGPGGIAFYWRDSEGFGGALTALAKKMGLKKIAIEGQRMRVFEVDAIRQHSDQTVIVDGHSMLLELRQCKDPGEVDKLMKAIDISEISLDETLDWVTVGKSEAEVRSFLVQRLIGNGADGLAFDPIVLSGEQSAKPHGTPSSRKLNRGEALLFDFGASVEGYHADITRTVFCDHVSDEHAAFYETVQRANARGRELARPEMTCSELDRDVTEVLRSSSYAEFILHKTGHGLGLDVHESPQIMIGNEACLEPGMVITIEPGLYRHGDLGVRIEDDVILTNDGCRSLTQYTRDIKIVGGRRK